MICTHTVQLFQLIWMGVMSQCVTWDVRIFLTLITEFLQREHLTTLKILPVAKK